MAEPIESVIGAELEHLRIPEMENSRDNICSPREFILDDATLAAEMRKAFDVLAEGLVSENSRDDRTAIEVIPPPLRLWSLSLSIATKGLAESLLSGDVAT